MGFEDILIIDIEASGLDNDSFPIEFAIGNSEEIKSWLIKPLASWNHWNINAEKIHGISRGKLEQCGISAHDAAKQIYGF